MRRITFKAWFKSKTADKVLSPVRNLIVDLMSEHCKVLDIGCGTGDLLFRAASKIEYGLGVDLDQSMIDFAEARKQAEHHRNLEFVKKDSTSLDDQPTEKFDLSTSTLCLHEMREQDAVTTLKLLAGKSSKLVIADYGTPKTRWGKISIEVDEFISGHYRRFAQYRSAGGIPHLARLAGLEILSRIETPIEGIYIWELSGDQAGVPSKSE